MSDKQQHVDLHRKLAIRERLLKKALPGPVYVPFVGEGDIAEVCYTDRPIYAADNDTTRVRTARTKLPDTAHILAADCTTWPFQGRDTPAFAIADFDAYSYPYDAFRAWWQGAQRLDQVVVFFTDGQPQSIKRNGVWQHPDGQRVDMSKGRSNTSPIPDTRKTRPVLNQYPMRVLKPWITEFANENGWELADFTHYSRGAAMTYWGAVLRRRGATIERGGRVPDVTPTKAAGLTQAAGKWPASRGEAIEALIAGATLEHVARQICGFQPRTLTRHAKNDPELAAAIQASKATIRAPHEKFDDAMKERFLDEVRGGKRPATAARACGIHRKTVYRHVEADESFAQALDDALEEMLDDVEDALVMTAKSGNVTALQVVLYNRRQSRWADRRNVSVTGRAGGPVEHEVRTPPEDLMALLLQHPDGARVVDELADMLAAQEAQEAV